MRLRVAQAQGPGWRVCPAGFYGPHLQRVEVLYLHRLTEAVSTWPSPGVLPRLGEREVMAQCGAG